jgi:hypothetical protein
VLAVREPVMPSGGTPSKLFGGLWADLCNTNHGGNTSQYWVGNMLALLEMMAPGWQIADDKTAGVGGRVYRDPAGVPGNINACWIGPPAHGRVRREYERTEKI